MIRFLPKFGELRIAILGAPLLPSCLAREGLVSIKGVADKARLSFVVNCSVLCLNLTFHHPSSPPYVA